MDNMLSIQRAKIKRSLEGKIEEIEDRLTESPMRI